MIALFGAVAYIADARLDASLRPPMGWRSWNALELSIDQERILSQARALTSPGPNSGSSLRDLGYVGFGVDDGWQACGDGVGGGFHNASGYPLLNLTRFPDLDGMVAELHQLGLKVGWYFNTCWCQVPEVVTWLHSGGNAFQDVQFLVEHNFDAVKVDGCGPAHNISLWSQYLEAAPRTIEFENCANNGEFHWIPVGWEPPGWLPATTKDAMAGGFNLYRISSDIAPQFFSAMFNLNKMRPFLEEPKPLSHPGAWAYPDMLQVANSNPRGFGSMTSVEWRTHFAAWCITSSPLVLGFDLTNPKLYNAAYPIISNQRAIAVNQMWAGSPGKLMRESIERFEAIVGHHAIDECENGFPVACTKTTFPIWQLWSKPLPEPLALHAVLLINLSPTSQNLTLSLSDLSLEDAKVTEVWQGSEFYISKSYTTEVQAHDSVFLLLSPQTTRTTFKSSRHEQSGLIFF